MPTCTQRASALILLLCLGFALPGVPAAAQTANLALEAAKQRQVCGTGTAVAASYLPNGSLQVSCRPAGTAEVTQTSPNGLPATGLSAGVAAGVAAGLLMLAIVANDDNGAGTTTSSTTTTD